MTVIERSVVSMVGSFKIESVGSSASKIMQCLEEIDSPVQEVRKCLSSDLLRRCSCMQKARGGGLIVAMNLRSFF